MPTKAERAWMDAIVELGCIACLLDGYSPRPTAVHHMLSGGRRIGHLSTIGLCDPGHHQNGLHIGLTCRHPWKAAFEAQYGTEANLLALLRLVIHNVPPERRRALLLGQGCAEQAMARLQQLGYK